MSTIDDVRKFALALPGVEEVQHWEYPAFRTKRRIFITLRPSEQKAMFHITEEHQEILFAARPEAFAPLHWGKTTRCFVHLRKVPKNELEALVREAWDYAMPPAKQRPPTAAARPGRNRRASKPAPRVARAPRIR